MKIGALRQTQLPVSSAGRGRCVCLLRLANFPGGPQKRPCENWSAAPGCRCPNMRRGSQPACKKQTAFLLRLADFCFAPRRVLAKNGALRQTQLPVSSTGCGRCVCPCSASPVSTAGSGSAPQPSTPRCFCRRQRLSCAASFTSLFLPQAALGSAAPLRGELACSRSFIRQAMPQLLGWCFVAANSLQLEQSQKILQMPDPSEISSSSFRFGKARVFSSECPPTLPL